MLSHPIDHPIAVTSDADCDGLSIAYHDCEHRAVTALPYGNSVADCFITRTEFERDILPQLDADEWEVDHNWAFTYWRETGYAADHRQVSNCEVSRPGFNFPKFTTAVSSDLPVVDRARLIKRAQRCAQRDERDCDLPADRMPVEGLRFFERPTPHGDIGEIELTYSKPHTPHGGYRVIYGFDKNLSLTLYAD